MATCPKCGTENPDGFRNCRECYFPFGMEGLLQGPDPAAAPAPDAHGQPPPPGGGPPGGRGSFRVISVRPVRRTHPGVWVATGIVVVIVVFLAAWFLAHGGGGGSAALQKTLRAMQGQSGWKAELRVDSGQFSFDPICYCLGSEWTGEAVFEGPGRFGLTASASGGDSYGLRIIDDRFYEWESYTRQWKDLGEATDGQRRYNPAWNAILYDELTCEEGESPEAVEGKVCRVYSFDEEISVREESILGDVEIPYRYTGKAYVDTASDLLFLLDYSVEIGGMGRTHYRYSFNSYGEPTSVDVPPDAVAPPSGGG